MSQTTSIDFAINQHIDCIKFIKLLENHGWTSCYDQKITYLPVNDNDMYDWQTTCPSNVESVFDELQQKVLSNEIIGIVLIDQATGCGGEVLIWSDYTSFSLSLSVKYKELRETEYYINRIKNSLTTLGIEVLDIAIDIM